MLLYLILMWARSALPFVLSSPQWIQNLDSELLPSLVSIAQLADESKRRKVLSARVELKACPILSQLAPWRARDIRVVAHYISVCIT